MADGAATKLLDIASGTLAGTCISVILSYVFHPYRPRPSFAALGRLMTILEMVAVYELH